MKICNYSTANPILLLLKPCAQYLMFVLQKLNTVPKNLSLWSKIFFCTSVNPALNLCGNHFSSIPFGRISLLTIIIILY